MIVIGEWTPPWWWIAAAAAAAAISATAGWLLWPGQTQRPRSSRPSRRGLLDRADPELVMISAFLPGVFALMAAVVLHMLLLALAATTLAAAGLAAQSWLTRRARRREHDEQEIFDRLEADQTDEERATWRQLGEAGNGGRDA